MGLTNYINLSDGRDLQEPLVEFLLPYLARDFIAGIQLPLFITLQEVPTQCWFPYKTMLHSIYGMKGYIIEEIIIGRECF